MSLDDTENAEIELHDLVTEVLEDTGLLSKIRAQLRAGLYLALDNDISETENYKEYTCLKSKLRDPDISAIFCLVKEFLEYFELKCTESVFDKETYFGTAYTYENREKLIEYLNIGLKTHENVPLLLQLLNIARCKYTEVAAQESTKPNETVAHNTTYDVPSMLEKSNEEQTDFSVSESETPQIIGVKTVPKENLNNVDQFNSIIDDKTENYSIDITENKELSNQIQKSEVKGNIFDGDDTYEGTSSIAEDSIFSTHKEQSVLIDFDKSLKIPNTSNIQTTPKKSLIDQTIIDENLKFPRFTTSPEHSQTSPSSEKKNYKYEKTERTEKLKPMSGLTPLSELPPVQINKNRNNDKPLLPSLYSKDFRDKSSLKEVDTLVELNYDSYENYEEDFTSSSSADNETSLNNALNSKDISVKSKYASDSCLDNINNANELSNEKTEISTKSKNNDSKSNSVKSLTLDDIQEPSI